MDPQRRSKEQLFEENDLRIEAGLAQLAFDIAASPSKYTMTRQ
jgi:hypothetical protein